MHERELTRDKFSSLYWIQLIVFVIIYTIISLCSSWIADFYNELRLIDLLPIVLLELLFMV